MIRKIWRAAVPGSGVTDYHAAGWSRANGTELHPLRLLCQLGDSLLAVLSAGYLPGWSIDGGKVAGQKIAANIGTG